MKIGWDIFFHHIWLKFGWVYDVINWLICIFKKLKYLWNEKRYLKIVNSIFLVIQAPCLCFKMGSIGKMWFSSQYHFKSFVFSVLPTPQEFPKQLNTITYNFLWNGPDKIARFAVVNDINLEDFVNRYWNVYNIITVSLAWKNLFTRPNSTEGLFR